MVIDQAEGDTNWDIVKYVARETRDNATHKPKLDVDFTAPACATNADCADANPCTVNERCQAGHCAVNPRSCEEQPSNLCTDDICDPGQPPGQECVHSSKCDDGFSCTDDSCNPGNGVCTNTPIDSNCTAEGCKVGTCVADPDGTDLDEAGCFITITYPDGTSCTPDSNQCTDDTCSAGQCTHPFLVLGTPCAADGNPCTDDICDGAGACDHPNNTAPCDDGLFCTGTDTCSGGSCQHTGDPCAGGPECNNVCNEAADNCAVSAGTGCADDGNVCTDDQCDGAGACGHPNNTALCNDGLFCTGIDTCSGGSCQHTGDPCAGGPECNNSCNETADDCAVPAGTGCADDGNVCTDDQCDGAGACGHPNNTAPCDDGLFCTGTDTCSGGSCQHTGDPCAGGPECNNVCNEVGDNCDVAPGTLCTDDGNVCTDDQCDGAGACGHPNNTAPCDDGLFCTVNDTCESGVCQGSARDCNAVGDQCHDGVCDENTNQCVGPPKADGTPCNDGNACTTPDTCTAGTCAGPLEPEACLDHFTCYKSGATRGSIKFLGIPNPPGLLLEDQFGPSTVEVKKPQFLCAPTDKNNENPGAELHTEHLKGYPIKNLLKPVFPTNIRVVDQFNPTGLFVNAKKQSHLLVPTVKSLTGPTPVPTPGAFTIDHFECYKVSVTPKTTKFLPVLVLPIKDQFGSMTVDVRKPKFLCNPVDKQGEDPTAPAHTAHLMCYQVKQVKTEPQFQKVLGVFVNNQFGPEQLDVKKPSELCVPALKNP
jgi:hypothetical protein